MMKKRNAIFSSADLFWKKNPLKAKTLRGLAFMQALWITQKSVVPLRRTNNDTQASGVLEF